MANLTEEPENQLITVLKANLTDPNSTNRVGSNWIFDDMPRKDLKKDSYPRISVTPVTETAEGVNIRRNPTMQYEPQIQIDVWVWAGIDGYDSMILTISGNKYEGNKLLTYLKRQVINVLDDNQDDLLDVTNIMWNYKLLASVPMGQDPVKKQIIRHRVEVGYDMFRGV